MQIELGGVGHSGASCLLPGGAGAGDLALFPERNPRPVLLVTAGGRVTYGNPAAHETARRLLGAGAGVDALVPAGLGDGLRSLWSSPSDDGCFELAVSERTLLCSVHLLRDRGLAHAYLADVTEARQVERDLFRARRQDALTGLGNRLSFEDRLEQALGDRGSGAVAVLLLDVDRLRRVNDGLGHAAGDDLLRQVARRLNAALPGLSGARGEAFRFQGDTFAVLGSDLHDVGSAPARLAQALQGCFRTPFRIAGQEVFATASVGVAVAPGDGTRAGLLLRGAALALDGVKRAGGGGFRCYSRNQDAHARSWLEMEGELHRALARGELDLAFQTQVELGSRREAGREALLRWRNPRLGSVPPGVFVPLAEESGLIGTIGGWVLSDAIARAASWRGRDGGPPPRVAVNVSPRQLHEPDFPGRIEDLLRDGGLEAERLELEITESLAMSDPERVAATLARLKRLGIGIAIDDFGTGYSSLAYLSRFPLDRLKLDRSFVAGLDGGGAPAAVARAVVEIGHQLGLRVLAEGVETEAQAERLAGWGCDEGQGYLFGRPRLTREGSAGRGATHPGGPQPAARRDAGPGFGADPAAIGGLSS